MFHTSEQQHHNLSHFENLGEPVSNDQLSELPFPDETWAGKPLEEQVVELRRALLRERQRCAQLEAELVRLRQASGSTALQLEAVKGDSILQVSGGGRDVLAAAPLAAQQSTQMSTGKLGGQLRRSTSRSPAAVHGRPDNATSPGTTAPPAQHANSPGGPPSARQTPSGAAGAALHSGGATGATGSDDMVLISRQALELLHLKERAMDAVKEGITIADCSVPEMPLIYINEGFSRMTGYSREYTLGKNCRFLQGPGTDPALVWELRQAIKGGRHCTVQLLNYRRSGDAFVNYLSITPIHSPSGQLTHYVGVQSDITELVAQKRAELAAKHAAVQAAAATEAKSQFLARMSHEIRTPLNGMIAVGQLLADTALTPAQWDLVNTIRSSGETLLTLISDILDFSRIEANKMVLSNSRFRLQSVVEAAMEIAGMQAAQKRLQVAYNMAPHVPAILRGDAQRLQQVLLNILNNAVKFTPEGEILLEVWAERVGWESREAEGGSRSGRSGSNSSSSSRSPARSPGDQPMQPLMHARRGPARPQADLSREGGSTAVCAGGLESDPLQPGEGDLGSEGAARRRAVARGSPGLLQGMLRQGAGGGECLVHFAVRDTGIGINQEDLGRLFQSFSQVDASTTRRYGGSGLGLTISQKLCEAMGGKMWAQSEGKGRGSTFRWYIRSHLPQGKPSSSEAQLAQQGLAVGPGPTPSSSAGPAEVDSPHPQGQQAQREEDRSVATRPAESHPEQQAQQEPSPQQTQQQQAPPSPLDGPLWPAKLWHDCVPNSDLGKVLPGKRVLLAEPCNMVRQVLAVALQRWGCQVCVAATQQEAIQQLALSSPPPPLSPHAHHEEEGAARLAPGSTDAAGGQAVAGGKRHRGAGGLGAAVDNAAAWDAGHELGLGLGPDEELDIPPQRHLGVHFSANGHTLESKCAGPFDVVLMDLSYGALLQALMTHCQDQEAQRVVFMGWPGERDPEEEKGGGCSPMHSSPSEPASAIPTPPISESQGSARPPPLPKALAERLRERGEGSRRQLGYVVVTRPVRQGRLRLALEEVLAMQVDPTPSQGGESGMVMSQGTAALEDSHSDDGCMSTMSGGSCGSLKCATGKMHRGRSHGSIADLHSVEDNSKLRLLLAEDNAINMKVALGILKRIGYTNITTATDGELALRAVVEAGGPDAFHVILMDLHMPKMGGLEVVKEVRRRWPASRTRIVAVTADAFEDTRDNCIAVGFDGWLAKPFRVEEFARVMTKYRGERQQA